MDLIILVTCFSIMGLLVIGLIIGALLLAAAFIGAPAGEYGFDLSDDDLL
jgi:hypothetical protein